jgi:MoxR-like ATPase
MAVIPLSESLDVKLIDSAEDFASIFGHVRDEVHKVLVGHDAVVDGVLIALVAGGHILLEGVPGLGKTLLVRTLAQVMDLHFSRIQFTPDLMPADVTGTTLLVEDLNTGGRRFQFEPGPLFANLVLADEINRATPKTQSALLEAMQEQSVTVGGVTRALSSPFFVLATQNPIEMEGTYPLPEAQLDRFLFKLVFDRPTLTQLMAIIDRTTSQALPKLTPIITGPQLMSMREFSRQVPIAPHVASYAAQIVLATHPGSSASDYVKRFVRFGSSPRGAQALVLASKIRALLDGRYSVALEDIRAVAIPALRHRIILSFEGAAEGLSTDRVVEDVVKHVSSKNMVKSPS